ncbi:MAG: DNA-3-methyladenine glycosylase [Clostridiales bacterium]|nr:DNA-3-methyladenine glycosylase [Clostridiales bacterium]
MLDKSFFNRPTLQVAQDLLGKSIVRNNIKATIIETEAYIGPIDKACHAYNFHKTTRNSVMFQEYAIAYIYQIYGMYHCFNIVTEKKGMPCAVLIRAIDITNNNEKASYNRYHKPLTNLSSYQLKNFSNGPGKVCMSLDLNKSHNGIEVISNGLYIEECLSQSFEIVKSKRINIDYASEAKDFLWRFYIKGNKNVSVI